ncbi:MAG: hypothetical protein LBP73_03535 [Clostridiales Family XIII bacterium]|jgi:hypothetical protein|nr:hypothetical protein [Clostridiales Family XIII bacterium]
MRNFNLQISVRVLPLSCLNQNCSNAASVLPAPARASARVTVLRLFSGTIRSFVIAKIAYPEQIHYSGIARIAIYPALFESKGCIEMLAKQEVISIVETLPEDIAFDEIVNALAVVNSGRRAAEDIRCGRMMHTEQMLDGLLLPES